ncbi:MAG: formate dehydrogenase accessory sulfurtransferase FdhD [Acidimicrobiia bacterium]
MKDVRRAAAAPTRVLAVDNGRVLERPDRVATEEPLQIRVATAGQPAEPLVATLRTPGADFELAAGFLLSAGIVSSPEDITRIAYCLDGAGEQHYNVVTVTVRRRVDLDAHERAFPATAACGLCGQVAIDDLEGASRPVGEGPVVAFGTLRHLPGRLLDAQGVFASTGGLHAAARFGIDGTLRDLREDVGRHNALDKLFGHAFLGGHLPLDDEIIMLSGRIGFELVQKAAVAGATVLAAVSAPSSLALDAAERLGMTVVGFLRHDRFNVYTGAHRIDTTAAALDG